MKIFTILILAVAVCTAASAQNLILNGSFENNTATGNTPNLGGNWPAFVSDSWEVDGGRMNLDTSYLCGTASDGNWFITNCPACPPSNYVSFSLKLSAPTVQGATYTLSFDKEYCGDSTAIEIDLSSDSTLMGTNINTFSGPTAQTWVHESYVFQAPIAANFLIVAVNIVNVTAGYIALDNFSLKPGTCSAYYTLFADTVPHNWLALNQATGTPPLSYSWHWGDGDSSIGVTPAHAYDSAGNYNICLTVTDSNNCSDTYCDSSTYLYRTTSNATIVSVSVVNTLITTVHEPVAKDGAISIYPNPARDKLMIRTDEELKNVRIEIFNETGEIIFKESVSNLSAREINLAGIPEGIYFVKINYAAKQFTSRLVVQKD